MLTLWQGPNEECEIKDQRVGSGIGRVGSGITASGSGIKSHTIGISSFSGDQGSGCAILEGSETKTGRDLGTKDQKCWHKIGISEEKTYLLTTLLWRRGGGEGGALRNSGNTRAEIHSLFMSKRKPLSCVVFPKIYLATISHGIPLSMRTKFLQSRLTGLGNRGIISMFVTSSSHFANHKRNVFDLPSV